MKEYKVNIKKCRDSFILVLEPLRIRANNIPNVNINIVALIYHLQRYANKVKGTGAAFAPHLLLYLFLSVQRINRNNQGETVGYKCSYAEIAKYFNINQNTAVRAAKWLERQDWLTITKDGKTSVFNLNVEKINNCLDNPCAAGM